MSLSRDDLWADLRYALDELERPRSDIYRRLKDAADLDTLSEGEALDRLLEVSLLSSAYSSARVRAETRIAHEAIEKGLKAILIDSGLPVAKVRARRHALPKLLKDVQKHNAPAFKHLERCFDSTLQYLESMTTIRRNTNIVEYFQEHGRARVLEVSRYESIEGRGDSDWGMIGQVYIEIIRALLSLIFGGTPKDINSRIEQDVRAAVLAESRLDAVWDAAEWLNQGPVRPRLEVIENLENNKVLRAAVRRCERESGERAIRHWAERLRRERILAKRRARAERRSGGNDVASA